MGNIAVRKNICIEQSEPQTIRFILTASELTDLTGYTARASIKNGFDSTESIDFTVALMEDASLQPNQRIFNAELTGKQTDNVTYTNGFWDAFLFNSSGDVYAKIVQGKVTIKRAVTQ